MKRNIYKVWMPRTADIHACFDTEGQFEFRIEAYKTKGRRTDYSDEDWPPKRAMITIEVED